MSTLPPKTAPARNTLSWAKTLRVFLEPTSLRMFSLGFSAGLPLLLVFGTLSFRLREAGIDRSTIGFLSWVGLAYGFKWVWSPLVDRMPIPGLTRVLGRRRSWLLLSQIVIMAALGVMAMTNPQISMAPVVWCAVVVAFASATQDIALDAFRIESADSERQTTLAAVYQSGYRLAMIWAGAGALWIAARAEVAGMADVAGSAYQNGAWQFAYFTMALSMLPGVLTVLFSAEPAHYTPTPTHGPRQWLQTALLEPFAELIARYRWHAALMLALIATYRISDVVMGIMANPFYVDMGYSKDEVATVTKIFGVAMTLVGALLSAALTLRMGLMRVLMLGAVLSATSNLLFAWLSLQGHNLTALVLVISADNLSSGIASAVFIAYLSSLTSVRHTATQYAFLSSMMLLLPKFIAGYAGVYVDHFGYSSFFTATALLGVPVLLLIGLASRTPIAAQATAPATQRV